jgi:hypothetical protein
MSRAARRVELPGSTSRSRLPVINKAGGAPGETMEDRLRLGPISAAENHFEFFVTQRHHSLCRERST